VVRFAIQPAAGVHLNLPILGTATTLTISPDGRRVVYSGAGASGSQLYLQSVDDLHPRALPGTNDARFPEFSPDGKWIAFLSQDDNISKLPVDGGAITTICPALGAYGMTWLSNKVIVFGSRSFSRSRGLWQVSADGGKPGKFWSVDTAYGGRMQWTPRSADDGKLVFYSGLLGAIADAHIGVITVATGKTTTLRGLPGWFPLGLVNGQLLYVRVDGALMAAPFNSRTLQAGTPVQIGDSIAASIGFAGAALSANGTLVYIHSGSIRQVMTVDAGGQARALIGEKKAYGHPRFSPDGRRLAFDVQRAEGSDIWIYDLTAHTHQKLTTEGINDRPEWTPDGKKVLYSSNRNGQYGLWWQLADASAAPEQVYISANQIREGIVAPDARSVLYREDTADSNRDIFLLPLEGPRKPVPLLNTRADELMPRLSPRDGKWLAYVSDESGKYEVYVRPLAAGAGRIPVSNSGGTEPLWSPDGKTIYYRSGANLMAASIVTAPALAVTGQRVMFEANYDADPFHPNYDVAPDGKSFIMLKSADDDRQLIVVQNWAKELRERTAGKH
jgi:Tol biopolymer transport system component